MSKSVTNQFGSKNGKSSSCYSKSILNNTDICDKNNANSSCYTKSIFNTIDVCNNNNGKSITNSATNQKLTNLNH